MKKHLQNIETELFKIRKVLNEDPVLKLDIDFKHPFLKPYSGAVKLEDIKLIIIGQDPTVRREESREKITATLNLDKNNSLRSYLEIVCNILQIDIDKELYATNLYKCFFNKPPADDESILTRHFKIWADLLIKEIKSFKNPIIISLGEPLIKQLIHTGKRDVKYFWDYIGNTQTGGKFKVINPNNNYLQRTIYPIAHQPTWSQNRFYHDYLKSYLQFITKERENRIYEKGTVCSNHRA